MTPTNQILRYQSQDLLLIFQADQRHQAWHGEEDQHDEGALQAEGEHRDVPQGLRGPRAQVAGPLPGQRPLREQEPLHGRRQHLHRRGNG